MNKDGLSTTTELKKIVKQLLKIPPHLIRVATLPSETLQCQKTSD